ncbi:MAG: hypothetical protein QMB11_08175 [Nonlabens sp.]|jgi:hypothetical protein
MEQLLLRTGITYSPNDSDSVFALGYGNVTTGDYGEATDTSGESRI